MFFSPFAYNVRLLWMEKNSLKDTEVNAVVKYLSFCAFFQVNIKCKVWVPPMRYHCSAEVNGEHVPLLKFHCCKWNWSKIECWIWRKRKRHVQLTLAGYNRRQSLRFLEGSEENVTATVQIKRMMAPKVWTASQFQEGCEAHGAANTKRFKKVVWLFLFQHEQALRQQQPERPPLPAP